MITLNDLHLGQKLFDVNINLHTIHMHIITGLRQFDTTADRIYLDHLESYIHLTDLKRTVFFTEEKAKRYLDGMIKQLHKYDEQRKRRHEFEKQLEEEVKAGKWNDIIGKQILIKIENGKWMKSYIKGVMINYGKRPQIVYYDGNRTNIYLPIKYNKNWKYWSELEELKIRKEELEQQIKKLESGEVKHD